MTDTAAPREWGCRTDDILVAHAIFRRLFSLLPGAIRSVAPGDRRRARTIAGRLSMAASGLHHHHHAEDAKLWDTLEDRAPGCALHVGLMRAQHARIAGILEEADRLARWWVVDGDAAVRDRLAERADALSASLEAHLRDEEGAVLPVVQQVLTQLEWEEVGEAARSEADPRSIFIMLGLLFTSGTETQRESILPHIPRVATVLYNLFGHFQFERAMADLGADVRPASGAARGRRLGAHPAT